jgi:hypothetical protein
MRGVIDAMTRWAAERETPKVAASSRMVRLLRSAAHASRTRRRREADHGRPRQG